MTKISVIIPAYNSEKTILATITSVQNQTFTDWEIIVIDDGSTDNTLKILEQIQDERIRIYSYDNRGVSSARNRGINHATGEFISFLDADDLWLPDKLELQLKTLQENPTAGVAYSLVVGGLEQVENLFTFVEGNKTIYQGDVYRPLLLANFLSCGSNILVRREAIASVGIFDSLVDSCEDWDYCLRLAAKWSFVGVAKQQVIHRKTPGSATTKAAVMEQAGLLTLQKAFAATPQLNYLKNQSLAKFYSYCAELYYINNRDNKDIEKALQRLWWAIKLYPPILRDRSKFKLLIKLLLRQLLPTKIIANIARALKQKVDVSKPHYLFQSLNNLEKVNDNRKN